MNSCALLHRSLGNFFHLRDTKVAQIGIAQIRGAIHSSIQSIAHRSRSTQAVKKSAKKASTRSSSKSFVKKAKSNTTQKSHRRNSSKNVKSCHKNLRHGYTQTKKYNRATPSPAEFRFGCNFCAPPGLTLLDVQEAFQIWETKHSAISSTGTNDARTNAILNNSSTYSETKERNLPRVGNKADIVSSNEDLKPTEMHQERKGLQFNFDADFAQKTSKKTQSSPSNNAIEEPLSVRNKNSTSIHGWDYENDDFDSKGNPMKTFGMSSTFVLKDPSLKKEDQGENKPDKKTVSQPIHAGNSSKPAKQSTDVPSATRAKGPNSPQKHVTAQSQASAKPVVHAASQNVETVMYDANLRKETSSHMPLYQRAAKERPPLDFDDEKEDLPIDSKKNSESSKMPTPKTSSNVASNHMKADLSQNLSSEISSPIFTEEKANIPKDSSRSEWTKSQTDVKDQPQPKKIMLDFDDETFYASPKAASTASQVPTSSKIMEERASSTKVEAKAILKEQTKNLAIDFDDGGDFSSSAKPSDLSASKSSAEGAEKKKEEIVKESLKKPIQDFDDDGDFIPTPKSDPAVASKLSNLTASLKPIKHNAPEIMHGSLPKKEVKPIVKDQPKKPLTDYDDEEEFTPIPKTTSPPTTRVQGSVSPQTQAKPICKEPVKKLTTDFDDDDDDFVPTPKVCAPQPSSTGIHSSVKLPLSLKSETQNITKEQSKKTSIDFDDDDDDFIPAPKAVHVSVVKPTQPSASNISTGPVSKVPTIDFDDDEDFIPAPKAKSHVTNPVKAEVTASSKKPAVDFDDDDDFIPAPKATPSQKNQSATLANKPAALTPPKSGAIPKKEAKKPVMDFDEDDDFVPAPKVTPHVASKQSTPSTPKTDMKQVANAQSKKLIIDFDDDDDFAPAPKGSSNTPPKSTASAPTVAKEQTKIPVIDFDDDDDDFIPAPKATYSKTTSQSAPLVNKPAVPISPKPDVTAGNEPKKPVIDFDDDDDFMPAPTTTRSSTPKPTQPSASKVGMSPQSKVPTIDFDDDDDDFIPAPKAKSPVSTPLKAEVTADSKKAITDFNDAFLPPTKMASPVASAQGKSEVKPTVHHEAKKDVVDFDDDDSDFIPAPKATHISASKVPAIDFGDDDDDFIPAPKAKAVPSPGSPCVSSSSHVSSVKSNKPTIELDDDDDDFIPPPQKTSSAVKPVVSEPKKPLVDFDDDDDDDFLPPKTTPTASSNAPSAKKEGQALGKKQQETPVKRFDDDDDDFAPALPRASSVSKPASSASAKEQTKIPVIDFDDDDDDFLPAPRPRGASTSNPTPHAAAEVSMGAQSKMPVIDFDDEDEDFIPTPKSAAPTAAKPHANVKETPTNPASNFDGDDDEFIPAQKASPTLVPKEAPAVPKAAAKEKKPSMDFDDEEDFLPPTSAAKRVASRRTSSVPTLNFDDDDN